MCVTSESDEVVMPNNGIESPALDDANNAGTAEGNPRLKKGPWTSAEDAILVEYVTKHGEGNWNAVQRHTGLARCGKSCRLRWANHLRPDLKKGAFTPEEENLIIELHAQIGNKWARMASEMPGRTDNEIKNYWNTRIKRRQRAGLPIYPLDVGCHVLNDNKQSDSLTTFSSGDAHCHDAMPVNSFDIPAIEFKNLALNQHVKPPTFLDIPGSRFLEIPGSGFVPHALPYPYPNKSVLPTMHPPKRFRVPESMFTGSNGTMSNIVSDGSQYQISGYVQNTPQPFTYSPPFDHRNSTFNHPLPSTVLPDSNAIINCNPPSLEPPWAMKQELPSFQNQEDNWGSASSPLPPLESADALIPTPPNEQHNPSCQFSMQDSGLLDVALHDSQTIKHTTNNSDLLSSHASVAGFNQIDGSSQLIHDHETAWERYGGLTSPFGHSPPTMFGEGNDETEAMKGFKFTEEAAIWFPTQYNGINGDTANEMFSQQLQDVFLASDCFDPENKHDT